MVIGEKKLTDLDPSVIVNEEMFSSHESHWQSQAVHELGHCQNLIEHETLLLGRLNQSRRKVQNVFQSEVTVVQQHIKVRDSFNTRKSGQQVGMSRGCNRQVIRVRQAVVDTLVIQGRWLLNVKHIQHEQETFRSKGWGGEGRVTAQFHPPH